MTLKELEKSAIEQALLNNDYETSFAASELGISDREIRLKMKEYKILPYDVTSARAIILAINFLNVKEATSLISITNTIQLENADRYAQKHTNAYHAHDNWFQPRKYGILKRELERRDSFFDNY